MRFHHIGIAKNVIRKYFAPAFVLFIYFTSYISIGEAKSFIEPCATANACSALLFFKLPSDMNIKDIAFLFSVDTITLLGANNIDLRLFDVENVVVEESETLRIPISCACVNGIRSGNSTVYEVKSGDTLSAIASKTFGGLVSYQHIANANQIMDPSKINVGQRLLIPFPCACHDSMYNSEPAMFLSYLVQSGDSFDRIAANFSLTSANLMNLNNMNSSSDVLTGDVIEIPIHACTSSFKRSANDYGLLISSGSYVITAQHCVQCSCNDNLQKVYCTSAPATISGSCPNFACYGSNLTIGQLSGAPSFESCTVTSCVYNGFKRRSIFSSLQVTTEGSCPASPSLLPYRTFPTGLVSSPASPASSPVNSMQFAPTRLPTPGSTIGPTSLATLREDMSSTSITLCIFFAYFLFR